MLSAAADAIAVGAVVDGRVVHRHIGGLRAQLLHTAVAHRERVRTDLVDASLRHVAEFEWTRHVDLLASGRVYRLLREELPREHPQRHRGKASDLLVLVGDDLRAA